MSRITGPRLTAITAALLALLVITAMPVSAAGRTSVHTTTADFSSGTLTNMTATSGQLVWERTAEDVLLSEGFEDGDIAGWSGDTPSFSAQTSVVRTGTYAGQLEAQVSTQTVARSWSPTSPTTNVTLAVNLDDAADTDNERVLLFSGGTRSVNIRFRSNEIQSYDGTGFNTVGTINSSQWTELKLAVNSTAGTFDLYKNGSLATADVDMEAANTLDELQLSTGSGAGDLFADDIQVIDAGAATESATGEYISDTHSVTNATTAWVDLAEVTNATADVTWEGWNGTGWEEIGSASHSTAGNKTQALSGGYEDWRVNITASGGGDDSTVVVDEEGVVGASYRPQFNNSSASPTTAPSESNPTLEIDLSDRDFGLQPSDTVTVDFYHEGALVSSDVLASNGTAESDPITPVGGTNDWYAEATDSYGKSATSDSFSFITASNLTIYNESAPSQVVDNVTVEVGFYFDRDATPDLIVNRTTSNGTISMAGLPTGEPFVVTASADGYYNRRIWVPSLFESQSVYLLPDNETAVQPTFKLVDFTGRYERESTVLEIQRAINGSWETVEGDYFGDANEVAAQLAFNERHRLVITNVDTGATRDLGPFTPTASSVVDLEVRTDSEVVAETFGPTAAFSPQSSSVPESDSVLMSARLRANSESLSSYTVEAYSGGGDLLYTKTHTLEDGGSHNFTVNTTGLGGGSVRVWVNWSATSGSSGELSQGYTVREEFVNEHSLLAVLSGADMGGDTPNALSTLIVLVLVLAATGYAATSMGSAPAGLAGIAVAVAGAVVGWIPMTWVVAMGLAWLTFTGVTTRV